MSIQQYLDAFNEPTAPEPPARENFECESYLEAYERELAEEAAKASAAAPAPKLPASGDLDWSESYLANYKREEEAAKARAAASAPEPPASENFEVESYLDNYMRETAEESATPRAASQLSPSAQTRIRAFKQADRSSPRERSRAAQSYVRALQGFADDGSEVLTDGLSVDVQKNQLSLYSDLGLFGVALEDVRDALTLLDTNKPVTVRLDSPGGDVFTGVGIYNLLVEIQDLTVIVDALAASSASLIPLAATKVQMGLGAEWMIHEPWTVTLGSEADHLKAAERIGHVRDHSLFAIYGRHLFASLEQIRAWVAAETWFSGEQLKPLLRLRTGAIKPN